MHQEESEQIIQGSVRISLKKLKQIFTPSELQRLYQKFSIINYNDANTDFSIVPLEFVSSIMEFKQPKIDGLKDAFLQDLNSYFIEDIFSFDSFAHIQFTNLTILNLSKYNLNSIQSLAFVYVPKLRCLELYNNKITNLNALAKADFPKLEVITFYHNPITQMERFYRIHSKKLTGYEFDNKEVYKNRVEDYRFLFKMQNPSPKMIKFLDGKRIDTSKKEPYKILEQLGAHITRITPRRVRRQQILRQLMVD